MSLLCVIRSGGYVLEVAARILSYVSMDITAREDAIDVSTDLMTYTIYTRDALARCNLASSRNETVLLLLNDVRDLAGLDRIIAISLSSVPTPDLMLRLYVLIRCSTALYERLSIIEVMRRSRIIRARITNSAAGALESFLLCDAVEGMYMSLILRRN